ncbi:hypothetical protein EJ03DRAFT_120477 [Teratosphaeria nubilosa]|uniref:Thioester reductase (TE) domain-containing protein n=1 Tax=Teratosphaeria nubilosa TaxID=161662 RepID=A0A6G1L6I5_9PEZI|nr:hypothetical protein EJ03DRAFT_120477 [Teratosphaeria nubilosa]
MKELPTHEGSGKVDLKALPAPPKSRAASPNGKATKKDPVETIRAIRDGYIASIQADLPAALRVDSTLDPDIKPTRANMCALKDAKTILLTGATGFLGAFLLNDLLESTSANIILTLSGHVETIQTIRDGYIAEIQADLPAALRADSTLDPGIKPNGAKMRALKEAKTILLTGATGFLGAFLLNDLFESTSANIILTLSGHVETIRAMRDGYLVERHIVLSKAVFWPREDHHGGVEMIWAYWHHGSHRSPGLLSRSGLSALIGSFLRT